MESIYSTSSSKFSANILTRRKHGNIRPPSIPSSSDIRQRILSARILRIKNLQNQLAEAQLQISDLQSENRMLRTLQKRQDHALSKYENTDAELPQLLNSHAEEIKTWKSRCKHVHIQNRELLAKIKRKDSLILSITDQNKHLVSLNNDKNLEEREKLTERVKNLEARLIEKDNEYKLLTRRQQLELKSFRTNATAEHQKQKELASKLEKANLEIQRLVGVVESIEKTNKMPGFFSRSYANNSNPKSVRLQRDIKLTINQSNEDLMKNDSISNYVSPAAPLLPLFIEKTSNNTTNENQNEETFSSKVYNKNDGHEFSVKSKNTVLPKPDVLDNQKTKSHTESGENFILKKQNSTLNSKNLALFIKKGMADVDRGTSSSSASSPYSGNGQYSDYYPDKDENEQEKYEACNGIKHSDSDDNCFQEIKSLNKDSAVVLNDEDSDSETSEITEKRYINGSSALNSKRNENLKDLDAKILRFEEDNLCDEIGQPSSEGTSSNKSTPLKKPLRNVEINLKNSKSKNGTKEPAAFNNRKQNIDPKKKAKLLADLKAIDCNTSFDS